MLHLNMYLVVLMAIIFGVVFIIYGLYCLIAVATPFKTDILNDWASSKNLRKNCFQAFLMWVVLIIIFFLTFNLLETFNSEKEINETITIEFYNKQPHNNINAVLYEGDFSRTDSLFHLVINQDDYPVALNLASGTKIFYKSDIDEPYVEKISFTRSSFLFSYDSDEYIIYFPIRFKAV